MSVQRIYANDTNHVRTATITASSVLASTSIRQQSTSRQGNGSVALTGSYTGATDATFDVEIVSASGTGRTSTPVFVGQGSGALSGITTGSLAAQTVTLTLKDMGVATQSAYVDFYGVVLRSKTAGTAGNALTVTVDRSDITKTLTTWSVFADLQTDQENLTGVEYNFGGLALRANGDLDANTPRIQFGDDVQVYRQWREFKDNNWVFHMVPALIRPVKAETPVYTLSGDYTVTISNGVDSEEYTGITTIHDLISTIAVTSLLVEVEGTVTKDQKPEGNATLDLPLITESYHLPVSYSRRIMPRLSDLSIPTTAPTEKLIFECVNNDYVGGETWSAIGSVSGTLQGATTGVYWNDASYGLTIPSWAAGAVAVSDEAGVDLISVDYAARGDGEITPEIAIPDSLLGINAKPVALTAVYTQNLKTEDCKWENAKLTGSINPALLGLSSGGGDDMAWDASIKTRLETLYGWRKARISDNTVKARNFVNYCATVKLLCTSTATTVSKTINLSATGSAIVYDASKMTTATDGGGGIMPDITITETGGLVGSNLAPAMTVDISGPTYNSSGYFSGVSAISFVGSDKGATSTSAATITIEIKINILPEDLPAIRSAMASNWGANVFAQISNEKTTALPGYSFEAADNEIKLIDSVTGLLHDSLIAVWEDATALAAWDAYYTTATTAISSDTSGPGDAAKLDADYLKKFSSEIDLIYVKAGLEPPGKPDPDTLLGAGSYQERNEDYWYIDGYTPIYTNEYYHSARFNAELVPVMTKEFAFVIACACTQHLKYGDTLSILVNTGGGIDAVSKTYQIGDTIEIPVVLGEPLQLSGGVTGDDTITWGVHGSASGSFADFAIVDNTPAPYSNGGLAFAMSVGSIPYALGDRFSFAIEGGTYRWRKNSGTWTTAAIANGLLSDGVSAAFTAGASPSFVAGDLYSFSVEQPAAPANVSTPMLQSAWIFNTSGQLTINFGSAKTISSLVLFHDLPAGTSITYSTALFGEIETTVAADKIIVLEGTAQTLSSLTLTISGAGTGSKIYWIYAGQPLTTAAAPEMQLRKQYEVIRGGKGQLGASYVSSGTAGQVNWGNFITKAEFDKHVAMIDHVKRNNDEPIIFLPHYQHTEEAFVCRVAGDDIEMIDMMQYHPDNTGNRLMSLSIPLAAVYQ